MQHKQNDSFYLQEAFNKLKLLNEDTFDLTVDRGKVDELQSFVADDIAAPFEEVVIDVNADDIHELADSYVGKVVLQCECCGTKLYKEPSEVFVNEEETLANIEEECPTCGKLFGYKVIGKIEPFEKDVEEVEVEISDDEITEVLKEALSEQHISEEDTLKEDLDISVETNEVGDIENVVIEKDEEDVVVVEDETPIDVVAPVDDVVIVDEECDKLNEEVEIHIDTDANGNVIADVETDAGENVDVVTSNEEVVDVVDVPVEEECGKDKVDENLEFEKLDDVTIDLDASTDDSQKIEDDNLDPVLDELNAVELNEGVENLSLDTEDTHMEMTSDENGKVTVVTEPRENVGEVEIVDTEIAPLSDEDIAEIEANAQEDVLPEDEFAIDEFDEETFDELGESFLKRVYENVSSFNTSNVNYENGNLVVEGLIKFESGKERATSFIFERFNKTKRNKVVCYGINEMFSKSKKAFMLKGTINEKKMVCESLTYNYSVKNINEDSTSDVIRIYGRSVVRK
jgi:hypothetical protein